MFKWNNWYYITRWKNKSNKIFDLYNQYSHINDNNFLEIYFKIIGLLVSIDAANKIFENNNFFVLNVRKTDIVVINAT